MFVRYCYPSPYSILFSAKHSFQKNFDLHLLLHGPLSIWSNRTYENTQLYFDLSFCLFTLSSLERHLPNKECHRKWSARLKTLTQRETVTTPMLSLLLWRQHKMPLKSKNIYWFFSCIQCFHICKSYFSFYHLVLYGEEPLIKMSLFCSFHFYRIIIFRKQLLILLKKY